jgi:nicotinamide riboside kinase
MQRLLLFYELLKAKTGILLLGPPCSGKSTLIHLLALAMNQTSANELEILLEELKRDKLQNITQAEFEELVNVHRTLESPDHMN